MKTAAAYIRVSTDDQVEYSPESQLKAIRDYARKNDMILPEEFIFVDEGISGRKAEKRPQFMKMIGTAKIKPKQFDVILLWKFSRFARNREDSIVYKSMLRKQCGIDVISVSEQLGEDKTSILIEALIEAMDEYYSINLAEEVRRGMTEKAQRGEVVSTPPFGYDVKNNVFVPNPETAPIVQMIFEKYLNGSGCLEIAKELNAMGIRTRYGNKWENRGVEYVLRNVVYTGKLTWTPVKTKTRDYNCKDTIITQGKHEPIIKQDVFDRVQKLILEKKKLYPKNSSQSSNEFLLKGFLKCSNCGGTLSSGGKNDSWQCVRYLHGKGCGVSHYTTTKAVSEALLPVIIQDLKTGKNLEKLDLGQHTKSSESQDVIKQIDRLKARLKRVREAYEAGVDTLAEYKASREAIEKEIETLQHKVDKAPNAADIEKLHQKLMEKNQRYIKLLQDEKASDAEKNEALHHIVDKIVFQRSTNHFDVFYSESYML